MTDFEEPEELMPFMMESGSVADGFENTQSAHAHQAYKRHAAGNSLLVRPDQAISGKGWGRVRKFMMGQAGFPKSVFFIVGTEFCERFSYYGMKAILVLYFTNILLLSENNATSMYHSFNMLCYFSPIFGAMIADGWLGKFKTIFIISQIYMVGNAVMCLTALPPQTTGSPELAGPIIGLLLIGLGTGGIKPCVSAFGGDQINPDQEREIQRFFSVFYFAINCGSLLSTFITPILHHDVQCFRNDCYALAFGVPAALMAVAIIIFISGRSFYKDNPPTGNVVGEVVKATAYAVKNRIQKRSSGEKKAHWLDWADDKYDTGLLEDIKVLFHVLFIFLPLPIFWALYDQQGSRWTLQARHMDGRLGSWHIKPDQMQALNPVFILLFIPLFEGVIYPLLDKCNVPKRPLQRMAGGMVLAAVAFVFAGFLQISIEKSEVTMPGEEQAVVNVINAAPCSVTVDSKFYTGSLDVAQGTRGTTFPVGNYDVAFQPGCRELTAESPFSASLRSKQVETIIMYSEANKLKAVQVKGHLEKPDKGLGKISVGHFFSGGSLPANLTVVVKNTERQYQLHALLHNVSVSLDVEPEEYEVYALHDGNSSQELLGHIDINMGGIYRLYLQPANISQRQQVRLVVHVEVAPNSVSILLQIPQYVVVTCGEILFSITGLEFSYSQAPASMKSCVQAAWLLTVAFGNIIVVIVAESHYIQSQAVEFFLFAGLMGVVTIIFSAMAWCYVYVTPRPGEVHQDTAGLVSSEFNDTSMPASNYQTLSNTQE